VNLEIFEREFKYGFVLGGMDVRLCGYVDSDFAGDVDSRRSTIGCLHFGKWSGELGVKNAKDSHLFYDGGQICCSNKKLARS